MTIDLVRNKLFSYYHSMAYCIAVDSLFGSRQVFWTYKDRLSNKEGSEPKVGFPSLGNLTFEQLESLEMLATFGHEDYLYVETGRVRELWDRNGAGMVRQQSKRMLALV